VVIHTEEEEFDVIHTSILTIVIIMAGRDVSTVGFGTNNTTSVT
jgi:hypothetical protein